MPVQSGVGVVDLLAQAVCMTVGTPGHEHAVGRHDLNLVPAVADVLGSDVHGRAHGVGADGVRSEEHTSELQSHLNLVCRLLLEKKKNNIMSGNFDTPGGAMFPRTAAFSITTQPLPRLEGCVS